MLRVTGHIEIDEREIDEQFVRASGPGGQNVNKLSTAVQLRFDVRYSPSLPLAFRIARFFDVSVDKMFDPEEEE